MEPRDISTAPTSGQPILGFGLVAGEINGISPTPVWTTIYHAAVEGDYPGFDWYVLVTDAYAAWMKPTHWLPLPPDPLPETL